MLSWFEHYSAQLIEEQRQLRLQQGLDSDEEFHDFRSEVTALPDQTPQTNCRWVPETYESPASDESPSAL